MQTSSIPVALKAPFTKWLFLRILFMWLFSRITKFLCKFCQDLTKESRNFGEQKRFQAQGYWIFQTYWKLQGHPCKLPKLKKAQLYSFKTPQVKQVARTLLGFNMRPLSFLYEGNMRHLRISQLTLRNICMNPLLLVGSCCKFCSHKSHKSVNATMYHYFLSLVWTWLGTT